VQRRTFIKASAATALIAPAAKVEMDGDLHLALQDATGKKAGIVVCEIPVTGKAYWDVGHAPKDQSNRRSHLPGYAAWEIHPVMKVTVQ
jgi:N-acetylglucosamine kinase-like BadF-type ATPase